MAKESRNSEQPEGLAAAREEMDVLDKLSEGVGNQIAELSKRPQPGKFDSNALAKIDHNYKRLKGYEELAQRCYGRTVLGNEIDDKDKPKSSFAYRITQANVTYIENGCFVIARNSPLASELVTAQPGEDREILNKNSERYLKINEVRTFEGPVSLRAPNQKPNFQVMALRRSGIKRPIVVEDIRATVNRTSEWASVGEVVVHHEIDDAPSTSVDAIWLDTWSGIYLGEAEEQSLGYQFFTRTTVNQERALNNPRGLTFVEGIAGAGKTSVALGRLKFFANFGTGFERDRFGLQNAADTDFAPIGMVGFVLSPSLKRYLKETADALELHRLPIRDFEEYRIDLCGRFGITENFRRYKTSPPLVRGRVNWLRAIDVAMARAAGIKLRDNLKSAGSVSSSIERAVTNIADELSAAKLDMSLQEYNVNRLAIRIVERVADVELRERESRAVKEFPITEKVDNARRRSEERAREREMRRIQREAERKIVSPLARHLLSGLTSHELLSQAVSIDGFLEIVLAAFEQQSDGVAIDSLVSNVAEIRTLVGSSSERPALTDMDLVVLVILGAMIAEGFDYVDQAESLRHLYQMRRHSAVFIDEVQDFAEVEIVLMGMAAVAAYDQVTLSGDRRQRLQSGGAENYEGLFPWIPRGRRNKSIFLDVNFRQRPALASFSVRFRALVQHDEHVHSEEGRAAPAVVNSYDSRHQMARFVLEKVRSVPRNASVAVMCATSELAQIWYDLLHEDLDAHHRPALLSRRDDLVRRLNVHFTEVKEAKGLEFDVVVVPDIGSFDLGSDVGRNQMYIAITRAKHALVLGCAGESVASSGIRRLQELKLISIVQLKSG